MISIFDNAVYGDVFYNGNGDKYRYVKKTDANGENNPFPYHLIMDDEFDWNKKPEDYISVCCYCPNGATCWAVIDHWDENGEMYKKYLIVKKGEREEPPTEEFHLFDGIKFGDRFRTRDGHLAVFTHYTKAEYCVNIDLYTFHTENHSSGYRCGKNGHIVEHNMRLDLYTERSDESDLDIVAKWDE